MIMIIMIITRILNIMIRRMIIMSIIIMRDMNNYAKKALFYLK